MDITGSLKLDPTYMPPLTTTKRADLVRFIVCLLIAGCFIVSSDNMLSRRNEVYQGNASALLFSDSTWSWLGNDWLESTNNWSLSIVLRCSELGTWCCWIRQAVFNLTTIIEPLPFVIHWLLTGPWVDQERSMPLCKQRKKYMVV